MDYLPNDLRGLQDDIDLYQSLLDSCIDMEGLEEDKESYRERLVALKEKVNRMASASSNQQPASNNTSAFLAPPNNNFGALPTRGMKRERSYGEYESEGIPPAKSRKSTPADSPAPHSPTDSIGSDVFDDFGSALGEDWSRGMFRNSRDESKRREEQRRQMEEDERLAKQLQEQWSADFGQPSQPTKPAFNFSTQQHVQSTLRPNGSFSKPAQPVKQEVEDKTRPELPRIEFPDSPVTISSSDDDFAHLSSNEWNDRQRSAAPPPRIMPPSFGINPQMPGSFPGSLGALQKSIYGSLPGQSVYGQPSQGGPSNYNSYAGSAGNPLDVESFNRSLAQNLFPYGHDQVYADPQEVQEELKNLLHNIRPDEEIDPNEASSLQPEGLKATLMPHQLKGLAWMKKMEDGHNKGGILADDMGLGKTIQTIALMLARRSPQDAHKPTLIVTPVALMDQWKRELSKLVRPRDSFTVTTLHGSGRSGTPWSKIAHYDVVLTSYGTLSSELKRKLTWEDKLKINPDCIKSKKDECAMLDDKAKFHRVVLDEAHNIKNRSTKTAMAACRVNAEFRWCLSGTPMQNSVEEIFSLIKFCRIRPYNDWEKFNKDIARPLKAKYQAGQQRAMEKVQALLKAILLRRTKKSEIDGKPILNLPEKHTIENRAIFKDDELKFYKALETQTQIQFNKFVKNGSIGQNYSKALVLLLRLRQCCCSPQLVINSADFVIESGVEGTDLVANAKELGEDVVNRVKASEEFECPICMDATENPIIFNPCGHALCHDCFSRMIDNLTTQEDTRNVRCPHCRADINTKKITDFVSFQKVYGEDAAHEESDHNGDEDDDGSDTASESDVTEEDDSDDGDDLKDFIVDDDDPVEAEDSDLDDEDDLDHIKKPRPAKIFRSKSRSATKTKKPKKSSSKKGKEKKKKLDHKSLADLRKEGVKSRAAKRKYLRQLAKIYEPCAKIDKTLELLHEIRDRGENEKTIVFSSFTSFLDLVEVPLHEDEELNNYTRYDGSMTAKDRNAAVLRFMDDPHCRTMLISLKAGNAGLNLTIANHVIILDPFWNPFVEYQAADRCHRIGQQKEVTVHRILIGEEGVDHDAEPDKVFTVEDRILALQEKKKKLVENALDENAASGIGRLGIRELGYLFGVNTMPTRT